MDILIVDDSAQMRRTVKAVIGDLVGEIHECGDGSEALAAYERYRPDWVLMDIMMDGMDGIEATRLIKNSHPEAHLAIVTSYDDSDLREAARAAGACEFVVKSNLFELRRMLTDFGREPLRANTDADERKEQNSDGNEL